MSGRQVYLPGLKGNSARALIGHLKVNHTSDLKSRGQSIRMNPPGASKG